MTFRNGAKEYLLTGSVFGVPMGLLFGLRSWSVPVGIIGGILSGFLFAFFVFLFSKLMEKKFAKTRKEISSSRRVICDGVATFKGNGGWLFLTEEGLEFYPHKINFSTNEVRIPMKSIFSVSTQKNLLVLGTSNEPKLEILVSGNKEWKEQIENAVKNCMLNN